MTRTIPTRLTHLKFSKLMEWAKENNNILQSLDRTELAKLASVALNFPVASSTFTPLSDALNVKIGKQPVEKKVPKEMARMAQIEADIHIIARLLQAYGKDHYGQESMFLERIINRLGDKK